MSTAKFVANIGIVVTIFFGLTGLAYAVPYTFTNINTTPVPYSGSGMIEGLNDNGQYVGYFGNQLYGATWGFVDGGAFFDPASEAFGTGYTYAYDINNSGDIVGDYRLNDGLPSGNQFHGYEDIGGVFTTIDDPSAASGASTALTGINNVGAIVGMSEAPGGIHSFVDANGIYTTVDDPSAPARGTVASDINDLGDIVGYYFQPSELSHGFIDVGGVYQTIDDPLATGGTVAIGINNADEVSGVYYDAVGAHGFVFSGGVYTTIDAPGGILGQTAVYYINNYGDISGSYGDAGGAHSFIAAPVSQPSPVGMPGPSAAILLGTGAMLMAGRHKLKLPIALLAGY